MVCFALQEAARHDPDNAEYRRLIKQYKLMESTKEAGNKAFKANNLQVCLVHGALYRKRPKGGAPCLLPPLSLIHI